MLKKSVTLPGFISALFLTWGITSSLLKLYSVEMSFVVTFMLSLLVLLALAAVFYNAVTIITVSASIVVLLVIYAFHFNAVNDYLAVGFTLIADTITFNADITDNGRFLFAALFCVIAAIPSILLFGRLRGALILGLVSGGLFFLELQLGAKNIYPELCAAASAVISVSAGSFARKLNPGGKSKSGVALRVLPLALAATICVTLITPVNADFMHNMAVEIFVDDYVDLFSLNTGFNRSRTVFSLSDYGYGEAQLGGPVSLSGNEVYSVRSSSPALLRVSTKDTYTGYSWESLRDKAQFRFDSPLSDDIRAATFNEGLPAYNVEGMDKLFSKDINTTVTILVPERRSELLNSGRPYGFSGGNITNFIPYFDTDGEVFSKRTLYQGLSYAVNEKLLNFTSAGFATAIQAYEAAVQADKEAGFTPDPEYAEMLRRYTSLPDGIPSGVYDFAALTDGIDSPYLKMLDLRERVSRQSTYTLTPSYVPEGREFVSWFLETREGYCTYYATAMKVFARILGLPARYVEGFSTFGVLRNMEGNYILTGNQAHAWCEIYLEGIGWIPVDATLEYASGDNLTDINVNPAIDINLLPTMPPQPNEGYYPTENDLDLVVEEPGFKLPPGAVYYGVGLLVVLLLLGFCLTMIVVRYPFRLTKHRDKEALLRYWRDILKMLPSLGINPRVGETPSHLAARAYWILYSESAGFAEVAEYVEDCVYGSVEPDPDALSRVRAFHRDMDRELMKVLWPHRYIAARLRWRKQI